MLPFSLPGVRHSIPSVHSPLPAFHAARQPTYWRGEVGQQCHVLTDLAAHPRVALALHVIDQGQHQLPQTRDCRHWLPHAALHQLPPGDVAMHPSSAANSAHAQVAQDGARLLLPLRQEPAGQLRPPVSIADRAHAVVAVRLLAPDAEQARANAPSIRQRCCQPAAARRAASFRTDYASCRAQAQTNLRDPVRPVGHHHRHRHHHPG